MAKPIPEGFHTITPHLVIKGADEAIAFYEKAFGAEEICRMPMPAEDGGMKIGHAELRLGDSVLFLADEFPKQGVTGPNGHSPVHDPPVRARRRHRVQPGGRGGRNRDDAAGRHVLG